MPRFLSYYNTRDYYLKHGCKLAMSLDNFKLNITKNKVPYYCPKGHFITNLTKNNFNARINQGRDPCSECSVTVTFENRKRQLEEALDKRDCKLVSVVKRRICYLCSCGRESYTYDNNVLKSGFKGCAKCTQNPFSKKDIQEKIRQTNMKKYGCENPFQSEEVKCRIRITNKKKYGVDNVMQNGEIFRLNMASAFKSKPYTFPNGRAVLVQGYEIRCIESLLQDYEEDEIVIGAENMPEIWYHNPEKNKNSRYYPDIYLPDHNILIEVKSDYTYNKELAKNLAKFSTVAKLGFTLHLYVYNKKELLYKHIYKPNGIVIYSPPSPAEIVFID